MLRFQGEMLRVGDPCCAWRDHVARQPLTARAEAGAMALDSERTGYWLSLWAGRSGVPGSALAEQLGRHRSQATHWLRGERSLAPPDLCRLLLYLRSKGALPEPGEVRHALRQIGVPLAELPDILAETPAAASARAEFLTWLGNWPARALDLTRQKVWLPLAHIERPDEVEQISAALLAEPRRPVLIWGMGGSGKTALANRVARLAAVRERFWNGVLWATLGPTPDWQSKLAGWCALLHLPVDGADIPELIRRLVKHLGMAERAYLLVLDDLWAADDLALFQELLQTAGILVTTRRRDLTAALPGSVLVEVGAFTEAQALTVLRGLGASPEVAEPSGAGEALVHAVENWPLAVTLLGQAVRLRGWAEIWARVQDCQRRLGALHRTNDRYGSAQLALQVSYDLLDAADQARFRRLGVVPYGASCALPAVAGLWQLADPAQPALRWLDETRDRLADLADRSLLLIVDDDAQAPRWRLHTVVHDYARFLLRQTGEWEATRAAFVDYYLGLAHELGQAPDRYGAQLTAEWPNLAGAFEHAWNAAAYDRCAFLLASLHSWLLLTGRIAALDGWLARLTAVEQDLSETARGWLAHAHGRRALALGEWDAGTQAQAAVLANAAVEPRLQAFQHFEAAAASLARGDLAAAAQAFAAGKQLTETLADANVDLALFKTGAQLALAQRDWQAAQRQIELAAEIAVAQDRRAEFVDLLRLAGGLCRDLGQPAAALAYYQSAWAAVRQMDAPAVELNILVELAPLAATHGELGLARAAAERLRAFLKAMELPEPEARLRESFACQVLAFVAQQEGRLDDALDLAQRAVALCRDAAEPSMAGDAWRVLAVVQAVRGDSESARQAYMAALAAYERAGAVREAQAVRHALAGLKN